MTAPLPVVGLDLSLTGTGVATAGGCRTIVSSGRKDSPLPARHARLADLASQIVLAVAEASRQEIGARTQVLVVLEAPAYDSRTGHQHDRSGLWWLVVHQLLGNGDLVAEVTTGGLKKYATGKGNASKDAVLLAVARRFPNVEVTDNNQADALVLRAMGCHRYGRPIVTVPAVHAAALEPVRWPAVDVLAVTS
jgi:crossover junction endodeoxyribonuclease RuvC